MCSKNKWRSRTAETIFKNNGLHSVKSAGTANSARIKVTQNLVDWADLIYVMERKHLERLNDKFDMSIQNSIVQILEISDDYQYMDQELIRTLQSSVGDTL